MTQFLAGVVIGYALCLLSDVIWTIRTAATKCTVCGTRKTDLSR